MRSIVSVLIVLILAAPVCAQGNAAQQGSAAQQGNAAQQSNAAQGSAGASASASSPAAVDVDRLPLDLKRIHKELKQVEVREERDGLNLRYRIEIYGSAPPLQLFAPDANLTYGPVPYGAPTHQEIVNHITPQAFRSPVMDFSALLRWLADRNKEKKKH